MSRDCRRRRADETACRLSSAYIVDFASKARPFRPEYRPRRHLGLLRQGQPAYGNLPGGGSGGRRAVLSRRKPAPSAKATCGPQLGKARHRVAVRRRRVDRSLRRRHRASDAIDLGFRVMLVKDACGSGSTAMHQTAILNLANRLYGGAVTGTDAACRLMSGETVEVWIAEGLGAAAASPTRTPQRASTSAL